MPPKFDTRDGTSDSRISSLGIVTSFVLLILFAIGATYLIISTSTDPGGAVGQLPLADYRLPSALTPLWYNLTVQVYLPGYANDDVYGHDGYGQQNLTFTGTVTIRLRVKGSEGVKQVVLNAYQLNITGYFGEISVKEVETGDWVREWL